MQWYFMPFKNFATFSGRARRKEYWTFVIINSIISGVVSGVGITSDMALISAVFPVLILIPTFAVLIRRLHDVGKGGGFLLINLIPVIGQLLLLINLLKDSNYCDNKFGPNPKRY